MDDLKKIMVFSFDFSACKRNTRFLSSAFPYGSKKKSKRLLKRLARAKLRSADNASYKVQR
jgi:hypothetical protein